MSSIKIRTGDDSIWRVLYLTLDTDSHFTLKSFSVCLQQEPRVILHTSSSLLHGHQIMSLLLLPRAANLGVSPSVSKRVCDRMNEALNGPLSAGLVSEVQPCGLSHTLAVVTSTHLLETLMTSAFDTREIKWSIYRNTSLNTASEINPEMNKDG